MQDKFKQGQDIKKTSMEEDYDCPIWDQGYDYPISWEHSITVLLAQDPNSEIAESLRKWFKYQGFTCLFDFYMWNTQDPKTNITSIYDTIKDGSGISLRTNQRNQILCLHSFMRYQVENCKEREENDVLIAISDYEWLKTTVTQYRLYLVNNPAKRSCIGFASNYGETKIRHSYPTQFCPLPAPFDTAPISNSSPNMMVAPGYAIFGGEDSLDGSQVDAATTEKFSPILKISDAPMTFVASKYHKNQYAPKPVVPSEESTTMSKSTSSLTTETEDEDILFDQVSYNNIQDDETVEIDFIEETSNDTSMNIFDVFSEKYAYEIFILDQELDNKADSTHCGEHNYVEDSTSLHAMDLGKCFCLNEAMKCTDFYKYHLMTSSNHATLKDDQVYLNQVNITSATCEKSDYLLAYMEILTYMMVVNFVHHAFHIKIMSFHQWDPGITTLSKIQHTQ